LAESDGSLVLRAIKGEEEAFGQLYDRYARLVRAICHDGTRDLERAADLAQEVFLRAYERLGELKEPERFGPWVAGIARNVARECRRSEMRDRHVWLGEGSQEVAESQEDQRWEQREAPERLAHVAEAMERLNDEERLALHSFYLQGQDVEKARRVAGVSRSSFYRLLSRARQRIEEYVREREGR